mgnify:FL=1
MLIVSKNGGRKGGRLYMCLCFSKKWGGKEETWREREWVRERGREA